MVRWLPAKLRVPAALARCQQGNAATEFAMVAPMFLGLITATLIFSAVLFLEAMLEGATREASRFGVTGQTPTGEGALSREEQIRKIVEDHTLGLLDVEQLQLETLVYQSFDQVGQPESFTDENDNGSYDDGEPFTDVNGNGQWDADMGAAGVGGPSDIVVYQVSYDWGLIVPMIKDVFGAETVTVRSSIAVRNEPFPGS